MSQTEVDLEQQPVGGGPVGIAVRHDVRVPAVVALVSAIFTVLWFSRALSTGSWLDWVWCVVPASVGLAMLLALRDSRTPLLLADDQGVRVRRGITWTGVRWSDVERVEVRSRRSLLHDGALVVHVAGADVADAVAVAAADAAEGGPGETGRSFEVPLGLGTTVESEGLSGDLAADLDALAAGQASVVVLSGPAAPEPEPETTTEPEPETETETTTEHEPEPAPDPAEQPEEQPAEEVVVHSEEVLVVELRSDHAELPHQPGPEQAPDALVDDAAVDDASPLPPTPAAHDGEQEPAPQRDPEPAPEPGLEPDRELRGASRAEVVRESQRRLPDAAIPAQRAESPVVTARIEDVVTTPVPVADPVIDPVIGPVVAAARHRARLSIDTLSERTRIRPHVLESIEVDDFAACGGDFYARGHLRTLARIFGLDAEELVRTFDERYAGSEIEARQVFEAELASGIGGGVRAASSGPRWSVLAAAVLVLVAVWGSARIFSDDPQELVSPAPEVVDSAGLAGQEAEEEEPASALAAIRFTASGDGSQVVVRDGSGRILWAGRLADGQSQQVIGTAPFDVTASNGQAVRVDYLGKDRGTVGESSAADNRRFGR